MNGIETGKRSHFSRAVLVPVIAAVLIAAGITGAFVSWSVSASDERALQRETKLVAHVLSQQLLGLSHEQKDVATQDYAVEAVQQPLDLDWIDYSFVSAGGSYLDFNRVYVLDPDLEPVYAMREGEWAELASYEADRSVVAPLAQKLQGAEFKAAIAAYKAGDTENAPSVGDIAILAGRPALISIMPVLSDSGDFEQPQGSESFHIAIRFLNGDVADELKVGYMIEGGHFDTVPNTVAGEALYPVQNAAGRFVAFFKWLPDRPGSQLIVETMPVMAGAMLLGGAIIVLLMRRLARSSRALDAARVEAQHRAHHDHLTGLPNRAYFAEHLRTDLAGIDQTGAPLALMMFDLDLFKQVNDSLGHEAGDLLLQQVAGRVSALLREGDTLARLGGDEFAILAPGLKSTASVGALAERLIDALRAPFNLAGKPATIGVSIGIALAHNAAQDGPDIHARADFALYQAKESGRNCYRMFEDRREAAPPAKPSTLARAG